jgi:signal transduction histidine kinase
MSESLLSWSRGWISWVSIGALLSVVALAWLAYRAVTGWQRSAEIVAQRTADASADLLLTAVTRDMRGVQATVVSALRFDDNNSVALDLNAVASAFARYPYPDAFFAARTRTDEGPADITFYSRANRPVAWLPETRPDTPFPVVTVTHPRVGDRLLERLARDLRERRTLSAFDQWIDGVPCQVVALLTYPDNARNRTDVLGFVVNLDWVRENYFHDLTQQIGRIRGSEPGLRLAVIDVDGEVRAGGTSPDARTPSSTRRFPLLFFDPAMIALDPPTDLRTEWWVAQASMMGTPEVMAARTGAYLTLLIASMSALVLAGGLGLSARAAVVRARLTEMRSDFVAAVTHELKTPTATIQAISESFLRRPTVDDSTRRDYGEIVFQEAKRLTRLIDNLLAYARISDMTNAYGFRRTSLTSLVRSSLKEFRFRLESEGFELSLDLPVDLPAVRADPAALSLAIGNLLDNAIRYSGDRRQLAVSARIAGNAILLEVADAGVGIPVHEIQQVTQKFFRGRDAIAGGSGLGLAITQRIVSDHSGQLFIRSEVGVGTTVSMTVPIAQENDDADPDC